MSEQTATPARPKAKKNGGKAGKKAKANGKPAFEKPPLPEEPLAAFDPPTSAAPAFDPAALSAEQRAQVEQLSVNLARAALTAQGAIADMALRQADRPAALSPDPFHVAPALTQVISRLAAQPDRMMRAQADLFSRYLDLWQTTARRAGGEAADPVVSPAKGDKRFADADWSDNPVFDAIKQSYLLTANFLNGLVSDVDGVDPLEKRRVEFFMK